MTLRYLTSYAHLSGPRREVAEGAARYAQFMSEYLPAGAETSAGLRKLLEARDCFERASLDLAQTPPPANEGSER